MTKAVEEGATVGQRKKDLQKCLRHSLPRPGNLPTNYISSPRLSLRAGLFFSALDLPFPHARHSCIG